MVYFLIWPYMLSRLPISCLHYALLYRMTYLILLAVGRSDPKLFCYYSSYAQNRPDVGKFLPENIDPDLCTHVIFTFADVIQGTKLKASGWNDLENGKDAGIVRTFIHRHWRIQAWANRASPIDRK